MYDLILICLLAASSDRPEEPEQLVPLLEAVPFENWVRRGGRARFELEDNTVDGISAPYTGNTFLCTPQSYGDFILEFDTTMNPRMNSGVQIRSQSKASYENGLVHGYQIELDPSDRSWSGGIFDEGRRGWIDDLKDNRAAREAFQRDGWNHFRVEARGDSIRTWVNGVPAADLVDPVDMEGFIALQVHGVGNIREPLKVRWRNLKIRDLGRRSWVPLLNGKNLEGWTELGGGNWNVENGVLVGRAVATDADHGILLSNEDHGDFTVRLKVRPVSGNSGFYFRAEPVDHAVMVAGFQAEIDPVDDTGGLYETGGRAWVSKPSGHGVEAFRSNDWNDLSVSAHGNRIVVHLNGVLISRLEDDPGRERGRFGLQLHGGQDVHVEFKDIELLGEASL